MLKRLFYLSSLTLLFTSCTTQVPVLYSWHDYEDASFKYERKRTDKTSNELMSQYLKMIQDQKGVQQKVPPGVFADRGYFLISQGQIEEGVKLLKVEIEMYPESKTFMEKVIERVEGNSGVESKQEGEKEG